jgi:hypothetical protein
MVLLNKNRVFWALPILVCLAMQAGTVSSGQASDLLLGVHSSPFALRHATMAPGALRLNPPTGSKANVPFVAARLFWSGLPVLGSDISALSALPALDGMPQSERGRSPPLA